MSPATEWHYSKTPPPWEPYNPSPNPATDWYYSTTVVASGPHGPVSVPIPANPPPSPVQTAPKPEPKDTRTLAELYSAGGWEHTK